MEQFKKHVRLLKVQYRMNEKIVEWSSKTFYDGQLIAHESVKNISLGLQFQDVSKQTLIDLPNRVMIDMENSSRETGNRSSMNPGEVSMVVQYVKSLVKNGVPKEEIGVITPYNAQLRAIRYKLWRDHLKPLEITTVDGFQGREKDVIVLSLVRSNRKGQVGFLSEARRINVAVTRARKHLAVICDARTISSDKTLRSFVQYCKQNGKVITASQMEFTIYDGPCFLVL